ncbi:hypothetical protein DQ384_00965 [Sphaerisporangium album]|uniref:FtsX extracellular domain-containing protein n=1 Tax=Sphaerisporangium album TaxID=509200 RepID=A0A367FRM2_9ACTN|nr:permease-like cell division protein FtsX [Sphaerisporangium album]RCG33053.1 hypothetical protein DQ384_00965 [Sphaerisporangium album]
MDTSAEPMTEELSHGYDPPSRLSLWARAHRRPLAVCLAAVVLLCASGAGGLYLRELSLRPLPPPDGPWPEPTGFVVTLCQVPFHDCSPTVNEAAKDLPAVTAALRAIPGVATIRLDVPSVRRDTGVQSLERDTGIWTSRVLKETPYLVYYPVSLHGTLGRLEDYARVAERARSIPGVNHVSLKAPGFWEDKADVEIELCAHGPGLLCTGVNDPSATEAQKQDIVDRLWGIDGVEKIYFEDRAHTEKVRRHYAAPGPDGSEAPADDGVLTLDEMTESFYVRLSDRRAIEIIGRSITDMPGVHFVKRIGAA